MSRYVLLASTLWLGCQPIPAPVPPVQDADATAPPLTLPEAASPVPIDAGLVVPPGQCAGACAVLGPDFLGCPEGMPTATETCVETCERVSKFPGLALPTAAVIKCRDIACVQRAGIKCQGK